MFFPTRLLGATLLRRYKRFLADVRLRNGRIVTVHCANSGSMLGCQDPGSDVYVSRQPGRHRRLAYTWEMVRVGDTWVGINTLHPNRLVFEAVESGAIKELRGYERLRREVWVSQSSRLDFCLENAGQHCFVEVKSVTLAFRGVAAFPDSVTARGTKHLKELIRCRRRGQRAVLLFVIQRGDCAVMRPADEIDGEYGKWLRRAVKEGVELLPYGARVTPRAITLTRRLTVRL